MLGWREATPSSTRLSVHTQMCGLNKGGGGGGAALHLRFFLRCADVREVGMVAGVVVGVSLAVLIVILIIWLVFRKKEKKKYEEEETPNEIRYAGAVMEPS